MAVFKLAIHLSHFQSEMANYLRTCV